MSKRAKKPQRRTFIAGSFKDVLPNFKHQLDMGMKELALEILDSSRSKMPGGRLPPPATEKLVDHPAHYGGDTVYEAIKVIEAWGLGFNLGNCLKYICRADKKTNVVRDLEKARWYLDREISRRKK